MNFIKINMNGFEFEIADTPVTQSEYVEIIGSNPSRFILKPNNPVEQVSWYDALVFIHHLNTKKDGYTYRLPYEKEWEFCCRAGSNGEYCFGNDEKQLGDYAWYDKNSKNSTQPVKQKKPNAFGLYDMHGNVWEWCSELYDESEGSYRVLRGGGWSTAPQYLRSAYQFFVDPGYSFSFVGFRLCKVKDIA